MDLSNRFGTVFIWVGLILLLLFVAADIVEVENLDAWYLVFGVASTAFGIFLKNAGRKTPEESARFRTLRKLTGGRHNQDSDEDDLEQEE
jgi:ABC-type transport system involved in cytochrome c biogenesis permease subunit